MSNKASGISLATCLCIDELLTGAFIVESTICQVGKDKHTWMLVAVQTVLQSDKDMGALLGSNQNFERWIKHGFSADDFVNTSNDSEEHLSQGDALHAASHSFAIVFPISTFFLAELHHSTRVHGNSVIILVCIVQ